jgi:5'-deoxynucleotidase YfbR-like HD superfamily hydrolase
LLRQQLEFIFNGAGVLRFHTTPPLRPQTDGQHSFGVAWLCYLLTGDSHCSRELLLAALAHDLAEFQTGDVPAQTKRQATIGIQLEAIEQAHRTAAGMNFTLNAEEEQILTLADNLEGLMFCVAERRLGNQNAEIWFARWAAYVDQLPCKERAKEVLEIIFAMWEEVCPTRIPVK